MNSIASTSTQLNLFNSSTGGGNHELLTTNDDDSTSQRSRTSTRTKGKRTVSTTVGHDPDEDEEDSQDEDEDEQNRMNGHGNGNGKKTKLRVKVGARASIACSTCRRRKVRCSGDWPICNFCTRKKLSCQYDGHPAESGGAMTPNTSMLSIHQDNALPDQEVMLAALDPFFAHYYDTFYFLHRPTLATAIRQDSAPKGLMFCVLAFAARFSQALQQLHTSSTSAASEHFASLASQYLSNTSQFGSNGQRYNSGEGEISLVRCQCLMMLGLYECTEGQENKGWLKIGNAIRLAQVMKLGFEDEEESSRTRTDPLLSETRRRTFWALFLLDRTVSDGRERPCSLKAPLSMTLHMPGPDPDFINGVPMPGSRFEADPPPWSMSVKSNPNGTETRNREVDLYGMTLRIAEVWQQVATYIGSGGRNIDRRAPWTDESTFAKLRLQLIHFGQHLTTQLQATRDNLLAHTLSNQGRLFGMLHLLYATATLVLHRDYLPFLPSADYLVSTGPVDGEPLYGEIVAPRGWWSDSIKAAVEASKTITQVQTHLLTHDQILTHPFAGFAALTAGTMHLHLKYWPQNMPINETAQNVNERIEATTAILSALKEVYPVGAHWCDGLAKLQLLYFNHVRGVLDSDPTKVRAGVIKLLRTAKEDGEGGEKIKGKEGSIKKRKDYKPKTNQNQNYDENGSNRSNVTTPAETVSATTTPLPSAETPSNLQLNSAGATNYFDSNSLFSHLDLHTEFALPAPNTTPGGNLLFDNSGNDFWNGPLGAGWNGFSLMSSFDQGPWWGTQASVPPPPPNQHHPEQQQQQQQQPPPSQDGTNYLFY